ncbi:pentapeptide repeat-containing protein [Lentzea tibetensis]|nr:pentapeptide repeat-containing protein [Lentzea tibetensis]
MMIGNGNPRDSVRLDAIRTASSIVLGAGGGAALLLAARRQRVSELDLVQKDHDATERRVTELYGKAADQLGNDKAPVRLAGLYALERLAVANTAHRQTIVNLLCAYLRMPFDPPSEAGGRPRLRDENRAQELEVRQAAQSLLVNHLRTGEGQWADVELNLAGATLVKLTLTHASVRAASFAGARFVGPATFRGSTFGTADFRGARFTGLADFRRASFVREPAVFRGAEFLGEVDFGVQTTASLTGAHTQTRDARRKWPSGWLEQNIPARKGWAALSYQNVPGDDIPETGSDR